MIVEWFLGFALDLIGGLLDAVLPDMTTAVPDIGGVLSGVATLNAFFPVTETVAAALFLMTVTSVMFTVKLIFFLKSHIPFIGGAA